MFSSALICAQCPNRIGARAATDQSHVRIDPLCATDLVRLLPSCVDSPRPGQRSARTACFKGHARRHRCMGGGDRRCAQQRSLQTSASSGRHAMTVKCHIKRSAWSVKLAQSRAERCCCLAQIDPVAATAPASGRLLSAAKDHIDLGRLHFHR